MHTENASIARLTAMPEMKVLAVIMDPYERKKIFRTGCPKTSGIDK